jgi:hypothetical protein
VDGPTLCRRAYRVVAYKGVMRLRVEAELADRDTPAQGGYRPPGAPFSAEPTRRLTEKEFRADSTLSGIVDWTAAG